MKPKIDEIISPSTIIDLVFKLDNRFTIEPKFDVVYYFMKA